MNNQQYSLALSQGFKIIVWFMYLSQTLKCSVILPPPQIAVKTLVDLRAYDEFAFQYVLRLFVRF
jgi:hypothetical protein